MPPAGPGRTGWRAAREMRRSLPTWRGPPEARDREREGERERATNFFLRHARMSIESLCIREKRNDPVSETTRKIQARALQCLKKYNLPKGDDCETKTFSSLAEVITSLFKAAITTIIKQGFNTIPREPDIAVVARAS